MKFPLKHPKYVVEDWNYYDLVLKKFKGNIFTNIEGYARRIIFAEKGEIKAIIKKIPRKLGITK